MKVRKWRQGTTTWVEVSASNKLEAGMPAVLVKCEGDGQAETVQLTQEWEGVVNRRREELSRLRKARVNKGGPE